MPEATQLIRALDDHGVPVFALLQALALVAAGVLFGARLFALRAIPGWPRATRNAQLVHHAGFAALGCVGGGALLGPLLRLPRYFAGRGDPFAPGFVMAWGAIGGATLATVLVARAHGSAPWRALDALAPALGVLVAIGRLGCFFAGCCFGAPSHGAIAIAYPPGTPAFVEHVQRGLVAPGAGTSLQVVPVAIAESALGVVLVLLGFKLARRRSRGAAFLGVIALYAAGRLVLERFRDDLGRADGLGVASLLSLAALAGVGWAALAGRDTAAVRP